MNRVAAVLALVLVPVCAWSQSDSTAQSNPKSARNPFKFDGYVVTTGYYDDNVFNYSPTDIAIIGTASDTSARFPIESVDDYVLQVAIRADAVKTVDKRTSWRARLRYDGDLYAQNSSRSHQQFGAELRWDHRRSYAEATLLWLPNYYLRELYWRPMPGRPPGVRYAPGEFTRTSFALEAGTRLVRGLDGHATLAYDRRDYKAPFDERDNDAFTAAAGLSWRVGSRVETQAHVYLSTIQAAGANSPDTLAVDISNTQYGGDAGVELKLDEKGRLRLAETLAYQRQNYTTDNPVDRFHYQRHDDEYGWDNQLTWRFHPHWQTRVFYTYRTSKTTEKVSTDEGAFAGNRVGAQMICYF